MQFLDPSLCPETVLCVRANATAESGRKSGRKEDMTCHLQRLYEDRPTQPSVQ